MGEGYSTLEELGFVGRIASSGVGKHSCINHVHLRQLIQRLDRDGDAEAADTIVGLLWNLEYERMRYRRDVAHHPALQSTTDTKI